MPIETLLRDVRYGLRRLTRDWRFTTAAVLILALGIGANTAIFNLINAILLRRTPVAQADRLVELYQRASNPGGVDANSYPASLDMAAYTDVFAATATTAVPLGLTYQHEGALRPATVEFTTPTFLTVLGLEPSLGRWFTTQEDTPGAEVVAVLGYQAWKRKFGGDPSVVGRTIRLEGVPTTIVGVGPALLNGNFNIGVSTDLWVPVTAISGFGFGSSLQRRPAEAMFFVKARLQDGVTLAQAQAAMDVLGRRLATEYPKEDPGKGISVVAAKDIWIHPQFDGPIIATATILLALVGLVLAIACSNLATLLLVRGAARAKDISMHLAIGATPRQLVRQLLTESVLLAALGGAAGCVLAWWGTQWLRTIELPVIIDLSLDGRVLAFAIVVSMITGVGCGLAPALKATKVDLLPMLRGEGITAATDHRRLTLKNALIVFQVSMSVLLLGCASLFLQWADAERSKPLGYAVDGVATIQMDSRFTGLSASQTKAALDEALRRVSAIPGVVSASLTRGGILAIEGKRLLLEGMADDQASALEAVAIEAGPQFLETLKIPLLQGRAFDARDSVSTPRVAVISETMARTYFGSVDPIGRRFRERSNPNAWIEVVGVAGDIGTDVADPHPRQLYLSYLQSDALPTTIVARSSQGAESVLLAMQRELRSVDATLPIVTAQTMAQRVEEKQTAGKVIAAFLTTLGAVGLLLASIGLYAVIAFAVTRRSREIGIRIALGAQSQRVVWAVARGVAGLVGVGTAAGLLCSVLVTLAFRAFSAPAPGIDLYRPTVDPVPLVAIALLMVVVGVAAAFVPARRASLTDPLVALRRD